MHYTMISFAKQMNAVPPQARSAKLVHQEEKALEKTRHAQVASLKISRDVVATISRVAALETPGVAGLSEPRKIGGLFSRGSAKPIEINLVDDFAEIGICLDLDFGASIPEVCTAVQSAVKDNVQTMTGIGVSRVSITVQGIVFAQGAS